MTPTLPPNKDARKNVVLTRLMVVALQDLLLEEIDRFAADHPNCDSEVLSVAAGQVFVAQCLKVFGERGFDEARKYTVAIVDAVENAYQARES